MNSRVQLNRALKAAAAELRRRLSWQEMSDIWHGMDIREAEKLRRAVALTEGGLHAHSRGHRRCPQPDKGPLKKPNIEGASIGQFLTELSSRVNQPCSRPTAAAQTRRRPPPLAARLR